MAQFNSYNTKQGKRWKVRGYLGIDEVTGKQKELKKQGFKTKKEAQLFYNHAKYDFENNTLSRNNQSITYKRVYDEWLEQYKNTVKESTRVKTESIFNLHVLPVFADIKINNITASLLQKQLNQWHRQFGQYKKVFNYCCKVFQYAVIQGYIESYPKDKVIMP
ncbi:site-specific integrase, partial [Klebsiella oxytoca]